MIKPVLMSKEIKFKKVFEFGWRMRLIDPIDFWILNLTNTETLLDRHKETLENAGFVFIRVFED